MADILLLEPGYSNKYPPIGLMKISYFHKYIHHDYVRFAKGELPEAFREKKWDRVYVTTLFTFEWERTKKALEYALSVVKDPHQVYTGGILATLMPELIAENFPTVKNNTGLLNRKGTLGLEHEECVDTMTLDYGILDDIADQYVYPAHDAYFTYMTRGCGMKCQFCAVQTLEPEYIPFISITESIKRVDEQFGSKKISCSWIITSFAHRILMKSSTKLKRSDSRRVQHTSILKPENQFSDSSILTRDWTHSF